MARPLKTLPLAHPNDPIVEITDESIVLDEDDLLDIDGSDDQTLALSKGLIKKLGAPKRNARGLAPVIPVAPPSEPEDNRATIPFGLENHAPKPESKTPRASTVSSPAHFAFAAVPPKNPAPAPPPSVRDAGSTFEPVSSVATAIAPAHFAAAQDRKAVSASFPPISMAVGATRERALSFIQDRPSRAGWIAAAVIAVALVIGGSMRVQSVALPSSANQPAELTPLPPPAAEPEAPKPVEAKVVQFADDQGVAIKPSAKPTSAKHVAPVKPAPKPATTATLAATADKKPEPKPAADKKKPAQTIDAELAEMQLRAAAR